MKKYLYKSECSYQDHHEAVTELFLTTEMLDALTLDHYLSRGWRKFGHEYFKPICPDCKDCIPIRVPVELFHASKSQKRVLKNNQDLRVEFKPLLYRPEIYHIYLDHTTRFPQKPLSEEHFIYSFFEISCPALLSEYYLDQELIATGFLDVSAHALSSVYFIYKTRYQNRKLGIFSILKEIEYTRSLGLDYYYLGYYISSNPRMAYKGQFNPHEKMDWQTKKWTVSS